MQTLKQLHEYILNANTSTLLSAVERHTHESCEGKSISIYFLTNFTIQPIEPILNFYLYESSMKPEIVFGQYDNIMQEILDNNSILHSRKFDIVCCSIYNDTLNPAFLRKLEDIDAYIAELKILFDLAQQKLSSIIMVNTFITPFYSEMGITSSLKNDRTNAILKINQFIRGYIQENNGRFILSDWSRYAQILGEQNSIDYRYAYIYKAPLKKSFMSLYASDLAKVARALNAFTKKCLILDCDNTLWGGIVGEDSLSGIKLDVDEYPGKIFYDFQQTILELHKRGVILALCSKNNEQDVWDVFESHPYSLLRRTHFAAHRINWLDKPNNIIELANELNIGLDSCVFIDDSQTECELVRLALPEVTVIEVPTPLYEYPSLLLKEGLFDALTLNDEDAKRNQSYQEEALRKSLFKNTQNIMDYLVSLELVATIYPMKAEHIPRVAQLTQKTNQFNLSTHRYTHQHIETFLSSPKDAIFCMNVKDKFGDYGLTGVFIAKHSEQEGFIDSYLLSCRILSRHLEYVFLEECVKQLSQLWDVTTWRAEYIPTEKNAQIKEFLTKSEFTLVENNSYLLNTKDWAGYNLTHIKVIAELIEGIEYA